MTYAKIAQFGTGMRKNQSINSDYVYTELQDPFLHGNTFGPMGRESRRLMISKCAQNWDESCDNFSRPWIHDKLINQYDGTITDSQGMLIKEAAMMRFCQPLDCAQTTQLVDPTVVNSPQYTVYNTPCQRQCMVNTSVINNDKLMNRVLENPVDNLTSIKNICNTHKRLNIPLNGTKIGTFCNLLKI